MIVVLTGGIASGKTAVTNICATLGLQIVDSDIIARQLTEVGAIGAKSICEQMGSKYFIDGKLDRKLLGREVFADKALLAKLNSILHPLIFQHINSLLECLDKKQNTIVCLPVYFESKFRIDCDEVWTIMCDEQTRIKRLMLRDNISAEQAQNIVNSQYTDIQRASLSDKVIDNNNDFEKLQSQVQKLCSELQKKRK